MSISSEIERIQTAKSAIITSIENKGVTVPTGATIDELPELIDSIPGGGGGGGGNIPEGFKRIAYIENTGHSYLDVEINDVSSTNLKLYVISEKSNDSEVLSGGDYRIARYWNQNKTNFNGIAARYNSNYGFWLGYEYTNGTSTMNNTLLFANNNRFFDAAEISNIGLKTLSGDKTTYISGRLNEAKYLEIFDKRSTMTQIFRVFSLSLKDVDRPLMELLPVLSDTNEYGFFDIVGGQFYPATNGNFSGGFT